MESADEAGILTKTLMKSVLDGHNFKTTSAKEEMSTSEEVLIKDLLTDEHTCTPHKEKKVD